MGWSARIEHVDGGLAIQFAEPVSRLDLAPDVAQHLASLLALEARARMAGLVRTLEAENGSRAAVVRQGPTVGRWETPAIHVRATVARWETSAKNSQLYVGQSMVHPLCCDCDGCLNGDHDA